MFVFIVYKVVREFRMIYSYKEIGDDRQFIPIDNKSYQPIIKKLDVGELLEYYITFENY